MSCSLLLGLSSLCLGSFLYGSTVDIASLSAKAKQGDAVAAFQLGNAYAKGNSVDKDCAQAMAWYQKAAQWNHVDALTRLGLCYLDDACAAPDAAASFACFTKAADKGDADGQNNLGVSYATGTGVAPDLPRAAGWFRRSASRSWSEAQFNLGVCYVNGFGVPKDLKKARFWFTRAAERGIHRKDSPAVAKRARQLLAAPDSLKEGGWVRNWQALGY